MPQGKMKTKVQIPKGVKQKQKSQKSVIRKGHLTIAPKKTKLVEASKLKKGLEKQLKATIEQKALSRAAHAEPKTLLILKSSAPSTSKSGPQPAAKASKKK